MQFIRGSTPMDWNIWGPGARAPSGALARRPASFALRFCVADAIRGSRDIKPPATGMADRVFITSLRFIVFLFKDFEFKILNGKQIICM
jgi:hypothetical protein